MLPVFTIVFLSLYGTESIVGIAMNAFVVIVNLTSWTKGTALTPTDYILLSLGLSNLCVQGITTSAVFSFFFCAQLLREGFSSQVFCFFFIFSNFSSFWLTCLLFLNYCLTIMNLSHQPFVLWLKMKLIKNMFWLPPCFIVVSFGIALISACNISTYALSSTAKLTSNHSTPPTFFHSSVHFRLFLIVLECTWPLLLTALYVILILKHIWIHIWNIKMTMTDSGKVQLKAHRSASRTLLCLLTLYVLYYLIWCAFLYDILSYTSIWFLICMVMFSILTSSQAITIILRNSKFRKEALVILQKCRSSTVEEHGQITGDISCVTSPP